jgi:septum formation protein
MSAASQMLVLASASAARRAMLEASGVPFAVDPANVDETAIKEAMRAEGAPAADIATMLAELKAQQVSHRHAGAVVLGADQVLECEGRLYDKPGSVEAARVQLLSLKGRTHRLISAAVVALDGQRIWHHVEEARLTVRDFSDSFLDDYLDAVGREVCASVGAYQIEGRGAQLFSAVKGDHFTIMGLPLLPLLAFLRERRILLP